MYNWHYGRKGNLLEWEKAKQKYGFNTFSSLSWLGLISPIPQGGGGGDFAILQIVFFISSVRDAAEPRNLLTFPEI